MTRTNETLIHYRFSGHQHFCLAPDPTQTGWQYQLVWDFFSEL